MAYGWGRNEPVIKPVEEGGDNINQYAQKVKDALDALYSELRQDIVRATLAESIAGKDIKKIITPSAAFRTYYGGAVPGNLQGKNGDMYIKYGDIKETFIKVRGAWQKIDAVPQPATLEEVGEGLIGTKYVTPETMSRNHKSDLPGGYPRLDDTGVLPRQFIPARMAIWDTPGTYTWTCPDEVTRGLLSGCGGGGGGGSASGSRGGTGGAGGSCVDYPIAITPGEVYTITIGTGGRGAPRYQAGGTGGVTSFGNLVRLGGGSGGGAAGGASNGVNGWQGASVASGSADTMSGLFGKAGAMRTSNGSGNRGTGHGSGGSGAYGKSAGSYGGNGAPGLLILKLVG